MGVLDRFLDAIKLNDEDDDYLEDEYLDDEDDFLDDEEPEEKPRRSFMDRFGSKKKPKDIEDAGGSSAWPSSRRGPSQWSLLRRPGR